LEGSLDKLKKKFDEVCEAWDGEIDISLGKRYCLIPIEKLNPILLALDTTSPSIDVSAGMSHVEMFGIENIEKINQGFRLIGKNSGINIHPDKGKITFIGDVKGSIHCD